MLADRYDLARAQQKKLKNQADGQSLQPAMLKNGLLTKTQQSIARLTNIFKALQQEDSAFKGESEACSQNPKIVGA